MIRPDFRGITHPPDIPIGMLYVVAYMEQHGYPISVFDLNHDPMPDLLRYDVIGISMLPLARKQAWKIIADVKAKKPEIKIVLGGVFPSSIPEVLVENLQIDAVVVGEGEESFLELIRCWENGGDISDVAGVCTRGNVFKARPLLDLESLPLPSWHHSCFDWFEMTYAANNPTFVANGLTLYEERLSMIIGSRGCCNNIKPCTFCDTPRFWQYRYRIRSAQSLLSEVRELYYKHGVRVFSFNDDAFPVSKKQCIEFCRGVVDQGMQIAWKADTRADVIDAEMAQWMKRSGCFMVAIGVESASEKILASIHKNIKLDDVRATIKYLKDAGIIAYVLLMVGNIGETKNTILETKHFLMETKPDIATWVTGVMLCAGTELYNIAKEQGAITDAYWLEKKNGMPIYEVEHNQESLASLANILSDWR